MSKPHFWTRRQIALLGTDTDRAIAKRIGISAQQVFEQRSKRGIPAYGIRRDRHCNWGQTELGLLRNFTDQQVAQLTGRALEEIAAKRREIQGSS